ncbi:MAG: Hsp20/alpha crystallin family protein [Erysipelotrichaceae bacterium]|nr:Hsp20/alpha crystallin family protein [Erysipelotrichaceae bacterium]MBR3351230.1 Hsp20/alpha crystallin family protein [Erysipelotrichaceae bacterium]
MLTPRIFTESLFDDLFDDYPFRSLENVDRKLYGKHAGKEMLTDVKEHENNYEVEIDLPGFKKEEITIELNEGYLTITASKGLDEDEKNKQGKIVRQERYAGVMQRSYYVGEQLTTEDIKAKYEDGVLKLEIPKKEEKKLPEKHTIMIEG